MTYYYRHIDEVLQDWAYSSNRKPLLMRGARQVGKTTAIRHLAESFEYYLEIDFIERKDIHYLFNDNYSPKDICQMLSAMFNIPIIENRTLVFFDEIQACPAAINKLRYFYERLAGLHVIAAGSLLEFALENLPSYGVGRIRSIFMFPFSFDEFVRASVGQGLAQCIAQASPEKPLPQPLHEQAIKLLRHFLVLGGMPAVVAEYCNTGSITECQRILSDLVQSFRDDFSKYHSRVPVMRIDTVYRAVAEQGLGKFSYSRVDGQLNNEQIRKALHILKLAGLIYPVTHSSSNGMPLGAEINEKYQRMIFMDTGLLQHVLGLNIANIFNPETDLQLINKGALAETYVGCEIMKAASPYMQNNLYCWHREKSGSNAEVDYVVQLGESIKPIEVKSGSKGSMQSMRIFLEQKKIPWGIRTSLENFSTYDDIKVYPLYAIRNIFVQHAIQL